MTVSALAIGAILLCYVERRLVWASGEQLTLAAAEVTDSEIIPLYQKLFSVEAQDFTRPPALPRPSTPSG